MKKKFLDLSKLVIRVWLILWAILLILILLKLCFHMWYPIVVESDLYNKICESIDKNEVRKHIFLFIFYCLDFCIWYMITTNKKKMKIYESIIIFTGIVLIYMAKIYITTLGSILEMVFLIALPIVLNLVKDNFKNNIINILLPIVIYILFNAFQIGMSYIRGINKLLSDMPTFMITVIQIDYYIFTILTWIGVCFMGLVAPGWFWSLPKTKLLALREKELKKENPNQERLDTIAKVLKDKYGVA